MGAGEPHTCHRARLGVARRRELVIEPGTVQGSAGERYFSLREN